MYTAPLSLISFLALAGSVAGCAQRPGQTDDAAAAQASSDSAGGGCTPLETRDPQASNQRPAFPGQTRGCGVKSNVAHDVTVLAKGLEHPWAVEPLPGGDLLVTEKPGRMRIISATGQTGQPLAGVPAVDARGQGGLLDVALSPKFESDRTIYWSYTEPRKGGNATSVARGDSVARPEAARRCAGDLSRAADL